MTHSGLLNFLPPGEFITAALAFGSEDTNILRI